MTQANFVSKGQPRTPNLLKKPRRLEPPYRGSELAKKQPKSTEHVLVAIVNVPGKADANIYIYGPYTSARARQEQKNLIEDARKMNYEHRLATYVRKMINIDAMNGKE